MNKVPGVANVAGISTLVVDMDQQCNATAALGVVEAEFTVNDVLYADQRASPSKQSHLHRGSTCR